jgi:nucleoside-diphosphate-sugar epimerase
MARIDIQDTIVGPEDLVLVTGAAGFIGSRVVAQLSKYGVKRIRCLVRSANVRALEKIQQTMGVEVIIGNLLSREDCNVAAAGVKVIIHLAAGRGEKSFADAYLNSVVSTRNLLDAAVQQGSLKRFVNVSSFTVYTNTDKPRRNVLDERCPTEGQSHLRGVAYDYAKVKQEDIVREYAAKFGIPMVMVRPGHVFGPGNEAITARVGIGTFGVFLHLGGSNPIPLTYVDNCADAIALAGLRPDVDGEVFNVVDDNIPTSRKFLRLYKKNVRKFTSIYVPHALSYALCWIWERYCEWSKRQLPPMFNRKRWRNQWKETAYSNEKLKTMLGWAPHVSMAEACERYFEACRQGGSVA